MDDMDIEQMLKFMRAAHDAVKDTYESEFLCPLCGGRAKAGKAKCNGHVHTQCLSCGFKMME